MKKKKIFQSTVGQRVLKTSSTFHLLYNAQDCIRPCRDVVIDLLRGSGPNAKLKKAEILEAARLKLRREVPNNEFTKVSFLLILTTKNLPFFFLFLRWL